MKVLLITNYWHFPSEKKSNRYLSLSNHIIQRNHTLEVWTSKFYHPTKRMRNPKLVDEVDFVVNLFDEPGYVKNISIPRMISQARFAKNIDRTLKKRVKEFDVVYCVVPTLSLGKHVVKICKNVNIPVMIDIQDMWPETFRMALDVPILSDILFAPMERQAKYIYSNANEVVAVSQTFLSLVNEVRNTKSSNYVYIGVDLEKFDSYKKFPSVSRNTFNIMSNDFVLTYVGRLSTSYNLKDVISAVKQVNNRSLKFIIVGDGPDFEVLKRMSKTDQRIIFTGNMSYDLVVQILDFSNCAINPINSKSVASIINKHADYFAAGLPVINTQQSDEYKKLLQNFNAGVTVNNDVDEIKDAIEEVINFSNEEYNNMRINSRNVAETFFNRDVTYPELVILMEKYSEK